MHVPTTLPPSHYWALLRRGFGRKIDNMRLNALHRSGRPPIATATVSGLVRSLPCGKRLVPFSDHALGRSGWSVGITLAGTISSHLAVTLILFVQSSPRTPMPVPCLLPRRLQACMRLVVIHLFSILLPGPKPRTETRAKPGRNYSARILL